MFLDRKKRKEKNTNYSENRKRTYDVNSKKIKKKNEWWLVNEIF